MSVNGPTTWNDVAMPGYRIANYPVNLTAWQMLPDRTIRNWADMTSYTQYNKPFMQPWERVAASNITNPNHISQWDPGLFSLGCPQLNSGATTDSLLTQFGIMQAGNYGYQRAMQTRMNMINSMVQNMAKALGSLEAQLTHLLENDKLTNKQKEKIEAKLEEVRELKEKIQTALENQASYEEIQELGRELVNLQQSVSELIAKIAEEVRNSNNNADDDNDVDDADDSDDNNDGADNTPSVDCDNNGRPTSLGEAPSKAFLREMCGKFSDAVNVWYGTDDDDFEAVLGCIDAGNVVEVMQYFNKNYGNDTNDTFLDNFLGDAEHFQKKKFGRQILNALITRAEANGIEDEIAEDVASANSEFNDCNISKHLIKRYLTNILDKIVAKEKANADAKAQSADRTRADRQQAADNRATEAKATFLADMREIWEDDNLQISDKVQYKDGKFTVRIQGENYSATSFKALVKKIEDADLDPKKYLAKGLNVNA